ncbi:MAG: LysR substrate-binding domain-containing protein [Bradymonadia bacterium]
MIEKLRGIAIFAHVIDRGSFRAAAQHLGLSPSRVSQAVSDLEGELGVTLLYRSTRRLSLSNEGRIFYEKARLMLDAAESGLDALSALSSEPAGELRITAPAFLTQTRMMDAFASFAQAFPKVDLHFSFSDHPKNIIKEGYDLAFRAGAHEDCALLARKLGYAARCLVASPAYVQGKAQPEHPSDLESWHWIRFTMRNDRTVFTSPEGETISVLGQNSVHVDSAIALYDFTVRGLGLTVIPEHLARLGFEQGTLVHVLPDWQLPPLSLFAIWPGQPRREGLTLQCVRFLAESMSNEHVPASER